MSKLSVLLVVCAFVGFSATFFESATAAPSDKKDKKPAPLTPKKAPDDKIKQLVQTLDPEIREKICAIGAQTCTDDPISVLSYKKQVVTGTNYFAAVSMKDKIYHVRIFEQTWTDTLEVVDVQGPKGKKDEIRYF